MVEILRKIKTNKPLIAFISCFVISIVSISLSSAFQSAFGQIDVQVIGFTGLDGENLVAKIYRPVTATSSNKAPGILAMHGFNNDKDVYRPSAIELARAGFVVLCIDQNGHGKSDGTYEENYDNLATSSYFAAFNYLNNSLSYVDNTNLGVMGHSMGAIEIFLSSLTFTPYCKAVVLETFGPDYWLTGLFPYFYGFGIENYTMFHNVLHIWAQYEEFALTNTDSTATWIAKGLAAIDLKYNLSGTANFDTTYNLTAGGWADGSMRRHALIPTTHPGLTANSQAIAEKVAWFLQALQGKSEQEAWAIANPLGQIWTYSEGFGLLATLFLIMSILPLGVLLMKVKFFKEVDQPIPEKVTIRKKSTWWIFATIATTIGALTYLFTTFWVPTPWGGTILPPILTPIFSIGIASTLAVWSLVISSITIVLFGVWYLVYWYKQRKGISFYDMGISYATKADKEGLSFGKRLAKSSEPRIIGKTILISLILFAWMYLWVFIADIFLKVPFRGVLSLLTTFTLGRFLQFWLYLIPTLLFFLIVGGVFLFGELKMQEKDSGFKTQAIWWVKTSFVLLGGLIVVFLLQYGTMLLGMGPFFNNPEIPNFDQHYPLMELLLFVQIPLYIVLTFVLVFFYRKTGKIYLGAIICSFIAVWVLVTSSCIYI